jgi:hypothetical protein
MDSGLIELLAPREESLHDDRPTCCAARCARDGRAPGPGLTPAAHRRDPMDWIEVPDPGA